MRRLALSLLLLTGPLAAQDPVIEHQSEPPTASIYVSATGEVKVPADFAVLRLGVAVEDSVVSAAADELDRRLAAISDTLVAFGIPADSLPVASFFISPVPRRGDEVQAYRASYMVTVTVRELDRLPEIITAGLAAGANTLSGLHFGSDREEEARAEALARAMDAARVDAEHLAAAAGVGLGSMYHISTSSGDRGSRLERSLPVPVRGASGGMAMTPSDVTVRAEVHITWGLAR